MRKKYRVIREDRAPKGFRVQVGETVYEPSVADYGIARLDSQSTGIEYISVTRDSDGKYPTFTIPLEDLAELHTAGVVVEIQEHRQPVERLMFRGNRFYGPVRHITAHKVDDFNRRLEVVAVDNPDIDQANDRYQICWLGQDENDPSCLTIHFQNGALLEAGVNGVSNEALIAVVMDRLQGFQKGPYQCTQNDRAIQRLQEALFWLQNRSDERARRGVEGTSSMSMQRPHFHVGQPVQLFLSMLLPDRSFKTMGPLAAVVRGDYGNGTYNVSYYGCALVQEVSFPVGTDPTMDSYIQPVPPIDYGPQDPAQR